MRYASLLLAATLLVGSACARGGALAPGELTGDPIPLTRLPEANSFRQYSGLTDSVRVVVRTEQAWREIWAAVHRDRTEAPALPQVDFERDMLVVAALGARPTGGFGIHVEAAHQEAGYINVLVRRELPGERCGSTQAFTQPVDIVRLPRSPQPVRFREDVLVRSC